MVRKFMNLTNLGDVGVQKQRYLFEQWKSVSYLFFHQNSWREGEECEGLTKQDWTNCFEISMDKVPQLLSEGY